MASKLVRRVACQAIETEARKLSRVRSAQPCSRPGIAFAQIEDDLHSARGVYSRLGVTTGVALG
jgi:hypothetical protein